MPSRAFVYHLSPRPRGESSAAVRVLDLNQDASSGTRWIWHETQPRGVRCPSTEAAARAQRSGLHELRQRYERPTTTRARRLPLSGTRHLRSSKYLAESLVSTSSSLGFYLERPVSQTNQGLDLTNPDAAQSVADAPLCLLSGLAAQAHVRHTRTLQHFASLRPL